MSEYRCILCGNVMEVSALGYVCIDEGCQMYDLPLPSEVIKTLDEKRDTLDVFLDVTNGMKYWKNMAFVARIERDEARQVARRMKTERDNARAMYEVLKMVLEQ